MLKKFLALVLVAVLSLTALASCGNNSDDTSTDDKLSDSTSDTTKDTTNDTTGNNAATVIAPDAAEGTLGYTLWNLFKATVESNPSISMEELANALVVNEHIPFMGMGMAVEAGGYFAGFNNYQIDGFKSGATFAPMMGSIAFVGYVFELEEGADVKAFIKTLSDNCDPRWNICVEADQTVIGAVGNTVFFVMCPNSIEAEGGEDVGGSEMGEVVWPEEESGVGVSLFDAFVSFLDENPERSADELAYLLATHEMIPFMGGSAMVEPGYLAGFNNYEVTGFTSGASFGPMMGSIAFVGYVFELEEGTDVANFIADLEANADLAWNICVEADQMVTGAVGNTVFFVMCPLTFAEA